MASFIPSASRVARGGYIAILGQSLALHYTETGSFAELQSEVATLAVSPTINNLMPVQGALSGRASARTIAEADGKMGADDYWWNDIDGIPGVMLTNLLTDIAALPGPLTAAIWNQGQADTNALNGSSMSAATAWTLHYDALINTIAALRSGLPTPNPNLPFFMDMPPSSGISRGRAYERLRQCDLAVIAASTNVFRGAEQYDVGRRDSTHLNNEGAREVGRRQGHNIAKQLYGATAAYRGPSVASVSKISATTTDIVVTVESGDTLIKPTSVPQIFRVESDTAYGTALAISSISWTGNTARLTHASCAGNPVFYPNYDDCRTFDITRLVYGSVSKMPLQSRYLGWTGPL
jgi:hypothetical protein